MTKQNDSKSMNTRDLLLYKGMELFALHGYDGLSLRYLASACQVNLAAVGYHFGGKEGLYCAIWEHVINKFDEDYSFRLTRLNEKIDEANGDRKVLAECAETMVNTYLEFSLEMGRTNWISQMIQWELGHPTASYDIIFTNLVLPVKNLSTKLTGAAWGIDPKSERCIIAAHAILGQLFSFFSASHGFLSHIGWQSFGPDEMEKITEGVVCLTLRALDLSEYIPAPVKAV